MCEGSITWIMREALIIGGNFLPTAHRVPQQLYVKQGIGVLAIIRRDHAHFDGLLIGEDFAVLTDMRMSTEYVSHFVAGGNTLSKREVVKIGIRQIPRKVAGTSF